MAGNLDFGGVLKHLKKIGDKIAEILSVIGNNNDGLIKDVNELKDTVGDEDTGLVKEVNDLNDTIGNANSGLVKEVNDLNGTVGNNNSGLVKGVNDLNDTVGNNNSGLVKEVNDLNNTIGDENSGLVKTVNTLEEAISNIGTSELDTNMITFRIKGGPGGNITIPPQTWLEFSSGYSLSVGFQDSDNYTRFKDWVLYPTGMFPSSIISGLLLYVNWATHYNETASIDNIGFVVNGDNNYLYGNFDFWIYNKTDNPLVIDNTTGFLVTIRCIKIGENNE